MQGQNKNWLKQLKSLVGAAGVGVLIGLPAVALFNPNGSVFAVNGGSNFSNSSFNKQTTPRPPLTPRPATPRAGGTIVQVAAAAGNFKTLETALKEAGLVETLNGRGPFTVFAPTDEAFKALPPRTLETLLKPENKAKLAAVLKHHVHSGRVASSSLRNGQQVSVLGGPALRVQIHQGKVRIGDATVVRADIPASNGVIHAIDKVLIPPGVL